MWYNSPGRISSHAIPQPSGDLVPPPEGYYFARLERVLLLCRWLLGLRCA